MTNELKGMTGVVTGATSGIGRALARRLAAGGCAVIGVGRSSGRSQEVEQEIRETTGNSAISFLKADFCSQAEIRSLAAEICARTDHVDMLVNNAGVFTARRSQTVDGVETQLAVNWLASFMLTGLLMPRLLAAADARIVNVSSGSHFSGRMHWSDPGLRRGYHGLKAYDQSKLAAVLFTKELARRFSGRAGLTACAVDPGLVKTEIAAKGSGALVRLIWKIRIRNGISPEAAAESVAWCAADPAARGKTGVYWKECRMLESSLESRDPNAARRLWELGESLSGVSY